MIDALNELIAPAAMERLTLVINHVLRADHEAGTRLARHQGRSIAVVLAGWPGWFPRPPAMAFRVTPAGLMEWCGLAGVDQPDLRLAVDVANPARLAAQILGGETPGVQVEGDAQLAAEVNWVLVNVRWDVAADLERLFGPVGAQAVYTAGRWLARGLRAGLQGVGTVVDTVAGRFGSGPR
jgi:ubiquinone biosynthesis accessory factor UbiJ